MNVLVEIIAATIRLCAFTLKQFIKLIEAFARLLRGCWFYLICLEKFWYSLWIENEFHHSLNYDVVNVSFMTDIQKKRYACYITLLRDQIHKIGL